MCLCKIDSERTAHQNLGARLADGSRASTEPDEKDIRPIQLRRHLSIWLTLSGHAFKAFDSVSLSSLSWPLLLVLLTVCVCVSVSIDVWCLPLVFGNRLP